jgi:hypothetical protein
MAEKTELQLSEPFVFAQDRLKSKYEKYLFSPS